MEFKRQIYEVNWKRLALMLLPVRLRQPRLSALLHSLMAGVAAVHALFTNFKKETAYKLTITGQVCYLQKMLNDYFDYSDRRIVIGDIPLDEKPAMYLKSEGDVNGLITYKEGEATAEYGWMMSYEAGDDGGLFTVTLPTGLVYDENKMRGLLDYYKIPTAQYKLIEV